MAHFVRHLPPKWVLVRDESFRHKKFREAICEQRARVEKSRAASSGMWWTDQRYVDQVVPARFVSPDHFDTFNYRYQVYAQPPPVSATPRCFTDASDQKVPVGYSVKRIAADKVWAPGQPICAHHWAKKPWQVTCCPPIRQEKTKNCSQNNNVPLITSQPYENDKMDGICSPQVQIETFPNTNTKVQSGVMASNSQNIFTYHHQLDVTSRPDSVRKGQFWATPSSGYSKITTEAYTAGSTHESPSYTAKTISRNKQILRPGGQDMTKSEFTRRTRENLPSAGMSVHAMACSNKDCVTRDTGISHLDNQNNSSRDDFINMSSRIISVDNLVGTDIEVANNLRSPQTVFVVGRNGQLKPIVEAEAKICIHLEPGFPSSWNYFLSRNNNAECASGAEEERPGCIPGQYCEYSWSTSSPRQPDMFADRTHRKPCTRRPSSRLELLSHLQDRANPKSLLLPTPHPDSVRNEGVTFRTEYELGMVDRGYMTYKIIGGKQYRLPPPRDYTADIKLPRHIDEYGEFTRRCPNPHVGRYDRSDPANEMLVPHNITSNMMKVDRNPFVYLKNSKCRSFQPLYYTPRETDALVWSLPLAIL